MAGAMKFYVRHAEVVYAYSRGGDFVKVGIMTMYYHSKNCGGLLQAYAMQKVLEKMGTSAEQICYEPKELSKQQKDDIAKLAGEKRKYQIFDAMRHPLSYLRRISGRAVKDRRTSDESLTQILKLQDAIFSCFEKSIPHSDAIYTEKTIGEANKKYDAFVCGSDQIWHLSYLIFKGYFLGFVDEAKLRIPYAVSTGKLNLIPEELRQLKQNISCFEEIGVRENSYAELLLKIHENIKTVLDPTLLLSDKEWERIENKESLPQEKYIFVYFLGSTKWHRVKVQKFANETGLKVIHLPYIMRNKRKADKYLKGEARWNVGPREFVALIHHAEFVFTDSFHAMMFSTIFQKEFFVFDRSNLSKSESMNFRISDFLESHHMGWRRITKGDKKTRFMSNYSEVNEILTLERKRSLEYLRRNLKIDSKA